MNIDPNSSLVMPAKGQPNAQAKLSPELELLLTQLKVRVGETLTATVDRITQITGNDYKALLQTKQQASPPSGKQVWQSLLSQPSLKLVELQHQQSPFSAITDLPIVKGQQLMVVVTNKGLQLLNPTSENKSNATTSTTSTATQPQTSLWPPSSAHSQTVQRPAELGSKPAVTVTTNTPTNASGPLVRKPLAPTNRQPDSMPTQVTRTVTPAATFESAAAAIKAEIPSPLIRSATSMAAMPPQTASHDRVQPSPTGPSTPQNPPPQTATIPPPTAAAVQALAQAVANALPKAQPTSLLLPSSTRLATLLQQIPENSLPPALKPLVPLLNKLQQQPLDLVTNKALPPSVIARAINNNGVFHERNALQLIERRAETQPADSANEDIKALLIKTLDSLGQPTSSQPAPATGKLLSTDAVARLWLSLVNGLGNKQETQKIQVSKKENLLQLAQTFAQNSLAKIQLNQYRSLATGPQESGTPNQIIHLDIPIRWPDHYGNAYLQIFPPKIQEDENNSRDKQKRDRRARWRIFMELEMGDEGNLAVELTVANDRIDATFWAEKDELRKKAAAQLQHLRSELTEQGLQVADLRCSSHPPPEQKMNLDYAIIDVRT